MGQVGVRPVVTLLGEPYAPAALAWHPVRLGPDEDAGQLLAAFELIQSGPDGRLPAGIPPLCRAPEPASAQAE